MNMPIACAIARHGADAFEIVDKISNTGGHAGPLDVAAGSRLRLRHVDHRLLRRASVGAADIKGLWKCPECGWCVRIYPNSPRPGDGWDSCPHDGVALRREGVA